MWNPVVDAANLFGTLFASWVGGLGLYQAVRARGVQHPELATPLLGFGGGFVALIFGVFLWMLRREDPLSLMDGKLAGGHYLGLMALHGAIALMGLGLVAAVVRSRWMVRGTLSGDPDRVPSPTRTEQEALLRRLDADALWQEGEHAVAAHVARCWQRLGEVEGWETDQALWERVWAQLRARYPSPAAQDAADGVIRQAYAELVLGDSHALVGARRSSGLHATVTRASDRPARRATAGKRSDADDRPPDPRAEARRDARQARK